MRYLGFVFNSNGDYKDHIKELFKRGRLAANKVWGLGERICKDDFIRRWTLFRYLVKSVMKYGVELWGWEERRELERVMIDYIRWVFKLKFNTPRYLIMRELGLCKLRMDWGIRARKYEEKIRNMEEHRWVRFVGKRNSRMGGRTRMVGKEKNFIIGTVGVLWQWMVCLRKNGI